jgi:phosphate starvation-inducible PhoH-like protein
MSSGKRARKENTTTVQGSFTPIQPKTTNQEKYLQAIRHNNLVFATGPAGTGKSYIATAYAAEALYYRRIEKVYLTRPAVEAEEKLGFLPGDLDEKYSPYIAPFRDILEEKLGKTFVDYLVKTKQIEPVPIGFMRGRTFKNCIVLIDEAQNTTPEQMKLILTRLGENCKCIVDGDLQQKDISSISGLEDALRRLQHIPLVKTIKFQRSDIVRSGLCQQIVEAYE